jgi:hypothetical protein
MRRIRLVLDLGDVLTKGIAIEDGRERRLRFPSFVAHRLLDGPNESSNLLIDPTASLPRSVDFEPRHYPRMRSYPAGRSFLEAVRARSHGSSESGLSDSLSLAHDRPFPSVLASKPDRTRAQARFAGWLAAAYGADRQPLGTHPSLVNIEALVRKAFILLTAGGDRSASAEVDFILDIGPKAETILEYVRAAPHEFTIAVESFGRHPPRRVEIQLEADVLDAPDCALSALPEALRSAVRRGILLIDVGYMRTKLAVLSEDGCDHQEQLIDLGVADCVRRILRDEQEQDLIEDELAVMRALERSSSGSVQIGGRRFDIGHTLANAQRAMEEEIARASARVIVERYNNSGRSCAAVAIFGGGAAMIGKGLAARIQSTVRLEQTWITTEDFLLVNGASSNVRRSLLTAGAGQ